MIAPIVETVSLAPYSDSFLQIRGHAFIKTRMQDLSHMRVFFHFQLLSQIYEFVHGSMVLNLIYENNPILLIGIVLVLHP